MAHSVAIIIPLYKPTLSSLEEISIKQCFKVLSKHKIIALKPESLDISVLPFKFDEVISFDNCFFSDIHGYNKLMLSPSFYEKFLAYQYILIYQPDAFVFRDDLDYWCNAGYDYIGAPWLKAYPDIFKKIKNNSLSFVHTKMNLKQPNSNLPTKVQFENRVGNGGFSLRNTRKFFELCLQEKEMITFYNNQTEHYFNEDTFWGIEVNRKNKRLKIPDYKKAIFFSIENGVQQAFKLTKGKLPFGCHAWDRHLEFWKPIFAQAGAVISS